MSLDIQQMRDELRSSMGMDIADLPDDRADLHLNRSYWQVMDIFHFREKEVTATFGTVEGERLYNLPSPFESLRSLSIKDLITLEHKTIDKMTVHEYENRYDESVEARGIPTRYVREGCAVRLWPTPDDIYTITHKYWRVLADLSDVNPIPEIPQAWHEIIFYGGLWRGWIGEGDYLRAREAKSHQKSLIDSAVPVEAKEEYDTHRAGLQAPGYDYDV